MNLQIKEIVERLLLAKDAYYNSDQPIMSDADFDALEDELKKVDPKNDYFEVIGSEFDVSEKKIEHSIPLLSMGKAKTIEEIDKWLQKINLPQIDYCLQPKIDGLSATCCYKNGKLQYVATRGNGLEGQDITYIAKYLKDIPTNVSLSEENIEIRGELYLPKDTSYDTKGKPLRNVCVGLINRKERHDDLRYVRFLSYQIINSSQFTSESQKIDFLLKNKFNTVPYHLCRNIDEINSSFNNYLSSWRADWNFETDGLIITINENKYYKEIDNRWVVDHHHHFAIALKPPAESRETVLENIDWQISRQGSLIPVAVFKPIKIGGAVLSRASLHNYENIVNLDVRRGDHLLVERANDVIPYVRDNLSLLERKFINARNELIPLHCPSCQTELKIEGVHLKCPNLQCGERQIQQILYWVTESEIENIAVATIRKLFELKKISSIKDLYSLKADDLIDVEGFATKKIEKMLFELERSRQMNAQDFITKLGIPLVGKKSLLKLKINSLADFQNFSDDTYVIGQNIIEWRDDPVNKLLVEELISVLDIVDAKNSENRLLVAMTGKWKFSRKEIKKMVEDLGYQFSDTVTAKVHTLLCENPNSGSSKLQKAQKQGIKVISYDDFFKN